jgi:hypothetical protein
MCCVMRNDCNLGRTLSYICEPSAYPMDRSVPFKLFGGMDQQTVRTFASWPELSSAGNYGCRDVQHNFGATPYLSLFKAPSCRISGSLAQSFRDEGSRHPQCIFLERSRWSTSLILPTRKRCYFVNQQPTCLRAV